VAPWLSRYGNGDVELALSDARELGQTATLMSTLYHAWFTVLLCGNYHRALALVHELCFLADEKTLEPIREVRIHDEGFAAARRRSMIRIIARRTNAATVVA
jgi:hypothetical protein